MSFRLVPKSVTLNGTEWRNGYYFVSHLKANYIKLVEVDPYCLQQKCCPKI